MIERVFFSPEGVEGGGAPVQAAEPQQQQPAESP